MSGFDFPDDGRAVAQCDWDCDGDLDIWVANRTGPQVRFLRNDLQTKNHYVALRLEGKTCNRDAIGARVEVRLKHPEGAHAGQEPGTIKKTGALSKLVKTLRAGEGFLAQSSKWLHFGLGSASEIEEVIVRWPGGDEEVFVGMQIDHHYHLVESSGKAHVWSPPQRDGSLQPSEQPQLNSTARARVVAADAVPLPGLEYETLDGRRHSLQETTLGRPVLVNLWASWCQPCLEELKEWAERDAELREAGVIVFALSVDQLETEQDSTSASTAKLLERVGYTGKAGYATAEMVEKLRLVRQHLFALNQPMSVPTSLLINSSGQLAALYQGPVTVDQLLADIALLPDIASTASALPFAGRWHTRRGQLTPLDIAWKLVDRGYLDESIDYIHRNKKLLQSSPFLHRLYLRVANHLLGRGNPELAVSYFREAMQLKTNYRDAQNNLAWVLSTHPDPHIRDGKEAIRLINLAIEQSPKNAFSLLDTLAAAYAEDGQFEKAVATAERAIEIAESLGARDFKKRIERRLGSYQAGKPYRDK